MEQKKKEKSLYGKMYSKINNDVAGRMTLFGDIAWENIWVGGRECAFNRFTMKPYSLLNQILLDEPGEYASFDQWKSAGYHVISGEKAETLIHWMMDDKESADSDGEIVTKTVPKVKFLSDFHISQTSAKEHPLNESAYPIGPYYGLNADDVIERFLKRSGLTMSTADTAYYDAEADVIYVPDKSSFDSEERYYLAVFHQIAHATGHPARLHRMKEADTADYRVDEFSHEELVAEITSNALLHMCGMKTPKHEGKELTEYIAGWSKAIKDNERLLVRSVGRAEKAIDMIADTNLLAGEVETRQIIVMGTDEVISITTDNAAVDIKKAIRDAANDFLTTKEGGVLYRMNGNRFDWADIEKMPDSICEKHGFRFKARNRAEIIDSGESILNGVGSTICSRRDARRIANDFLDSLQKRAYAVIDIGMGSEKLVLNHADNGYFCRVQLVDTKNSRVIREGVLKNSSKYNAERLASKIEEVVA